MTDSNIDQPLLGVAQTPSFCRLCNVEFRGAQTWRAHLKSDEHVYKLRLKVAEPGSVTSPPTPPPSANENSAKSPAPSPTRKAQKANASADQDQDVESEAEDESPTLEFIPGRCLFCPHESDALDDNMTHMGTTHGFSVPFQDFLAVELETVIWYFQFVIHSYRECISCGVRRSTVEGIQHHMVAKGHCRFDISPDTEEFYEIPQSQNAWVDQAQRDSSMPVRLPSGKLISNRKNLDTQEPRRPRRATPDGDLGSSTLPSTSSKSSKPSKPSTPGLEVARRQGGDGNEIVQHNQALLAAQLSKLVIASVRVQQKEEARKRGRLESKNNIILMKNFRLDSGDARIDRRFNG